MLITRRHGSWVVLGTLITDVELEASPPLGAGLRRVPAVHRRLPDRRARRAGGARRESLSLLLDAGAGADTRGVPREPRLDGLRLRHLPGRLPLESRRREAPARAGAAARRRPVCVARGVARGRRRGAGPSLRATLRAEERPALAAPERARRARQRRPARGCCARRAVRRTGTTSCCASTQSGRSKARESDQERRCQLAGAAERDLRAAAPRRTLAGVGPRRRGPVRRRSRLRSPPAIRLATRRGPGLRSAYSRSGRR